MPGLQRLRAKLFLTRWSLLLWLAFTISISITAWQLFPGAHFMADGGFQGIRLVVLVDLVLGPLLFFVAANPEKSARERRIDIALLMTVQLCAMGWGAWQVYSQHPVAVSHLPAEGMLVPVTAANFSAQDLDVSDIKSSMLGKMPAFHVLLKGPDAKKALEVMQSTGTPVSAQRDYLRPLFDHSDVVFNRQERFIRYWGADGKGLWEKWSHAHGNKSPADYRQLLFRGRHGNAILLVNPDNTLAGHILLPGITLPEELF